LRSGPANSLEYCVDRFSEASRKFKNREPEQLRWGTRIEEPGVMDLIEVDDVVQKLELAHASLETRSSLD
jgi:heptosyltransferase I